MSKYCEDNIRQDCSCCLECGSHDVEESDHAVVDGARCILCMDCGAVMWTEPDGNHPHVAHPSNPLVVEMPKLENQ